MVSREGASIICEWVVQRVRLQVRITLLNYPIALILLHFFKAGRRYFCNYKSWSFQDKYE